MSTARSQSVGIIGSGCAGLITAYTLLQDGFEDVQILTRDCSPGGTWARERVYPGLSINNVHGEYNFCHLPMALSSDAAESGGHISGENMCHYMESFSENLLEGKFKFNVEVINIKREAPLRWTVTVRHRHTAQEEQLTYARLVLCTGGCSAPRYPPNLSPDAAREANFKGPVVHSTQFGAEYNNILSKVKGTTDPDDDSADVVIVVGGGKSAQDVSSFLAKKGRKVFVVFERTDAALAVTSPLPDFIRKSRLLSILSGHIELRTRLERFLHTTWLGSKIVHWIWGALHSSSLNALSLPKDSPLRNTHSLFWGIRVNDEGVYRPNTFHALANAGKIKLESPARVVGYGKDGHSVILQNGKTLRADAVVLATGYTSSWKGLFDEKTFEEVGIGRHPPKYSVPDEWKHYKTLKNPPEAHPDAEQWASSIYRGIIPAKNINHRDFAINGAVFTTNNGYFFDVASHWISSYFLNDHMRLPATPEEAVKDTERNAAWLRKRFPDILLWTNESYSSNINFWTWPQAADQLLDDMYLPNMRGNGNWFNWPFKVVDVKEIATLKEERDAKRKQLL